VKPRSEARVPTSCKVVASLPHQSDFMQQLFSEVISVPRFSPS